MVMMLLLFSCKSKQNSNEGGDSSPVSPVKVTHVVKHVLQSAEQVPATVTYLDKSNISASSTGYLTQVNVQTGSEVNAGQVLFKIETREHKALQGDTVLAKTGIANYGVFSVSAPAAGFITQLLQQQGDFVQEGTPICTFTRKDQALVKALVPYSMRPKIAIGKSCQLLFPDSTTEKGKIQKVLNVMDVSAQRIQVLIKPEKASSWPEGLNLYVSFPGTSTPNAQLLPQTALLSNERLTDFWVMKLLDDSTAVKIPVKIGETGNDSVQVIQPEFSVADRLITEGGYGLADTAKVKVIK